MDPVNDASAGSSPAPLSGTDFLESLTDGEREAFFNADPDTRAARMAPPDTKTTKATTPAKKQATPSAADADSAPATPVEQAASTDASSKAASEPAAPAKETKGLDAREEQIRKRQAALKDALAETDRLERELAERHARLHTPAPPKEDAPADSSPAAAQRAFERYAADPRAPKIDAVTAQGTPVYDSYDAWAIDMMEFITDRKLTDAKQSEQQQRHEIQRQQALDTAVKTSSERVKAFAEKTPDFESRVHPKLLDITPLSALKAGEPIGPHNFIAEQMWRSEYPGEFALHFSEHPEDFAALMALPDPEAIVRRMGRLEAQFVASASPPPSRDVQPVPKTIPDADELPVVVGKKSPVTVTDTESAMKSGDFGAYERAWKRERGIKD